MSHQLIADYTSIEKALKVNCLELVAIASEVSQFKLKLRSDFEDEENRTFEKRRLLNPSSEESVIRDFVREQFDLMAKDHVQYANAFSDKVISVYIPTIVLCHAFCEALINAILAVGLQFSDNIEVFELLDKSNLKDKWELGPKTFLTNYVLKRSDHRYGQLSNLCSDRNSIVHSKITILDMSDEEPKKLTEGSKRIVARLDPDGIAKVLDFVKLPYRLHKHLVQQVENLELRARFESLGIDMRYFYDRDFD